MPARLLAAWTVYPHPPEPTQLRAGAAKVDSA
jgi:hypothetical protein